MEKSMQLQSISMITMLMFTQMLASSVTENKNRIPVIKQFMRAAHWGDNAELRKLHAQNGRLVHHHHGLEGWSALHHATYAERGDVIALLLALKASIHTKTKRENTPLHMASRRGSKNI